MNVVQYVGEEEVMEAKKAEAEDETSSIETTVPVVDTEDADGSTGWTERRVC